MARRPQSNPPVLPGFSYLRPLGSGGFADVFLYEQDFPRRPVAVKVLSADAINPEVLRLFIAEADTMAQLGAHPSIVTIYQASISADGRPYLAMEFCAASFGDRYKQAPLSVPVVLDAGVRVAAALETAHRSGVLHRDIKPSNILVSDLGQPVLSDFGIAGTLSAMDDADQLVAMSIPWSSPEVVTEQTAGDVRSEVWSLGATLYTLLAGRSPFAAPERDRNTRDQLRDRVVRAQYTPLHRPDVPAAVERFLARTMAKDPAMRPQSMLRFAEELRDIQLQLGLLPTAIEVRRDPRSSVPLDRGAPAPARGPVLTTVDQDSRRAARAARAPLGPRWNPDEIVAAPERRGGLRAGLIGGAIGVVVAVIVVVVLLATGVIP